MRLAQRADSFSLTGTFASCSAGLVMESASRRSGARRRRLPASKRRNVLREAARQETRKMHRPQLLRDFDDHLARGQVRLRETPVAKTVAAVLGAPAPVGVRSADEGITGEGHAAALADGTFRSEHLPTSSAVTPRCSPGIVRHLWT